MGASLNDIADDVVVRELDVYLCRPDLGSETQFCLLQCPLRPAWRPYNGEKQYSEANFKPQHRRLQLKLPLDRKSENYDRHDRGPLQMSTLTLESSVMDMHSSFAVGSIKENALYITPLDFGLQMRPSLAHLDTAIEDEKLRDMDEDGVGPPQADGMAATEYQPMTVNVHKRETERQIENRTKSYAYLKEAESKEEWRKLSIHPAESLEAGVMWDQLQSPGPDSVSFPLSPISYLKALSPGSALLSEESTAVKKTDVGNGKAAAAVREPTVPSFTPQMRANLTSVFADLFARQPVNNLEDVRNFLRDHTGFPGLKAVASAPDSELHAALMACNIVHQVKKVYISKDAPNLQWNDFWSFLIQEMEWKEVMKKSEIAAAARGKVAMPDGREYNRILKELCTSSGAFWALKKGA